VYTHIHPSQSVKEWFASEQTKFKFAEIISTVPNFNAFQFHVKVYTPVLCLN
jgi:hypothetical protein